MLRAACRDRLDIVRYVAKKAPELIDMPNQYNEAPIMLASGMGMTLVVRHLARLGCSLSRKNKYGFTALDIARDQGHHETARLLSDVDSAGGWRLYAAACRMAYVRIRHEVSKTYAVLEEADGVGVAPVSGEVEGGVAVRVLAERAPETSEVADHVGHPLG